MKGISEVQAANTSAGAKRKVFKFTHEEDEKIMQYYQDPRIPLRDFAHSIKRNTRAVKERYMNYLSCTKKNLSYEELRRLDQLVNEYGKRWKKISSLFPGTSQCIVRDEYNRMHGPKFRSRNPAFYTDIFNIFDNDFSDNTDFLPSIGSLDDFIFGN